MRPAAVCCDCGRRPLVRDRARVPMPRHGWTAICAIFLGMCMLGAGPAAEPSSTPPPAAATVVATNTPTPLLKRAVTTYAGAGVESQKDGPLLSATFADVSFIAVDPDRKSLYVTDKNEIRELTKDGNVVTVAGSAAIGSDDGTGSAARFNAAAGIAYDPIDKALYICDSKNFAIRRMTTAGVVTTIAGSP